MAKSTAGSKRNHLSVSGATAGLTSMDPRAVSCAAAGPCEQPSTHGRNCDAGREEEELAGFEWRRLQNHDHDEAADSQQAKAERAHSLELGEEPHRDEAQPKKREAIDSPTQDPGRVVKHDVGKRQQALCSCGLANEQEQGCEEEVREYQDGADGVQKCVNFALLRCVGSLAHG